MGRCPVEVEGSRYLTTLQNGRVSTHEARLAIRPAAQLFTSLPEQLSTVRRWNEERHWGFRAEDFHRVDLTPRAGSGPLIVDVIAVYLDERGDISGIRRTCHELWTLAAGLQPNTWCWDWYSDRYQQHPKPVLLRDQVDHRPGIRRVTLDLGAHFRPGRQIRAGSVRGPDSAHAEVLAAAAHFPRWIRAMDGKTVPHTWIGGYEVVVRDRPAPERVLALSWSHDRHTMSLTAGWSQHAHPGWAAPVIVG